MTAEGGRQCVTKECLVVPKGADWGKKREEKRVSSLPYQPAAPYKTAYKINRLYLKACLKRGGGGKTEDKKLCLHSYWKRRVWGPASLKEVFVLLKEGKKKLQGWIQVLQRVGRKRGGGIKI